MAKTDCIKKIEFGVVLLFLTFAFMGCDTIPKPKSGIDTLFVVPVVYLDSQTILSRKTSFGYKLTLENVQTGKLKYITINSSKPYIIIKRWDAGEYLLKEYSSIGFVDNWTRKLKINQYLKLEMGKVTVFPCKIVIILLESTSQRYRTSIAVNFVELYEDDYEKIRAFLNIYGNFHLWKS